MLAYRVEPVPGEPFKFMLFDKETDEPANLMDRMVTQEQLTAICGFVPADQVKQKVQEIGREFGRLAKEHREGRVG